MIFFRIIILLILLPLNIFGQVLINEIQSSNISTISDEFGEFPDWIEISNISGADVNLNNWFLSDDKELLKKWVFPEIILNPNAFLLVYASGRDIKQLPQNWNTIIDLGADWKYTVPSNDLPANWTSTGFDDSSWSQGVSSFGYDNVDGNKDDSTTVPNGTLSIYLHKRFSLTDISLINSILFHIDYDDGFVAYLNGIEIARVNMGAANSAVRYSDYASGDHEGVLSEGGIPEMFDISNSINLLHVGENILSVEVHNISNTSSDLTAIPFLTLGLSSSTSGEPGKYLNLGTAAPHTNFKISSGGETIILSSPDSTVVDSLELPALPVDISYGVVSGTSAKDYFNNPTPGYTNDSVGSKLLVNDTIRYSRNSGIFASSVSLSITSDSIGSIYYTTDGTEPSSLSNLYKNPLTISTASTIKARIIKPGFISGKVYSTFFIIGRDPSLPVISLTTDDSYLWDYNIGMYASGPNAQLEFPHYGANFWNDWEYPFSFVYFDEANTNRVSMNLGAKIFGGWSRGQEQKSFALFAREEYGAKKIKYPLFKSQQINSYSSVVLRNSGNDWSYSMMRDGLMTGITSHLNLEHQAFQPTVVYLNGEYWGVYNLREKVNEDFLASHYNLDSDSIIMLQNNGEVLEGDNVDYLNLLNFLEVNPSLASYDKITELSSKMDIDNYIKYQLIQIYIGNDDWPGNNIKYWKSSASTSKWRWILFDTDFGFSLFKDTYHNTLSFALDANGPDWPNPPWSTLLFRRLLTNTGFRNNFINQLADNINTTFTTSNVSHYVDSLAGIIDTEMHYHTAKWGQSYDNWKWNVQKLKDFGYVRPNVVRDNILNVFNLKSKQTIVLTVSDANAGRIRINTITPSTYSFTGIYFEDVPITVEAIPALGHKFVKWEIDNTSTDRILTLNLKSKTQLRAVFERSEEELELVINEINYKSSDEYDSGDWIELYNPTNSTFSLSGVVFSELEGDTSYVFPDDININAGGYIVLAKNLDKFKEQFPNVVNVMGEFPFGLSSTGDELRLYNKDGIRLDAVDYLSTAPWPINANGLGYTLELKDPALDNGIAENWKSDCIQGTPGKANYNDISSTITESLVEHSDVIVFPTKFTDFVSIKLNLVMASDVYIDIVDIQGRIVHQIRNTELPSGDFIIDWLPNGDVLSGVYFVKVWHNKKVDISRVMYFK